MRTSDIDHIVGRLSEPEHPHPGGSYVVAWGLEQEFDLTGELPDDLSATERVVGESDLAGPPPEPGAAYDELGTGADPPAVEPGAELARTRVRVAEAAACGESDADFFADPDVRPAEARRAKAVCATCPVRAGCLRLALGTDAGAWGIWGGTTPGERAEMSSGGLG